MFTEKKLPVSDLLAELSSVSYYKEKLRLAAGTYRVIEHDGEVNYAVRDYLHGESWYSEDEYQAALSERLQQAYLDQQQAFEPEDEEELMESWDNAMIRQEGQRLADEIPDDRDIDKPVKTLGDLLRAQMRTADQEHIEADDMAEAEYENHRSELSAFNQHSSEQLDQVMGVNK